MGLIPRRAVAALYPLTLALMLTGCAMVGNAGHPQATPNGHPSPTIPASSSGHHSPSVHPVAASREPAVSFQANGPSWSVAVQPKMVLSHRTPEVLTVQGNQVLLWRRAQAQWHRQVLTTLPTGTSIDSDALACDATACYAAVAEFHKGPTDNVVVFQAPTSFSGEWHEVGSARTSHMAAVGMLDVAPDGSTLWLLATGGPALGLMPKQIWVSQNRGAQWTLLASSDVSPVTGASLSFPPGYPTGITAVSPNRAILSDSSRGGDVTAVEYGLHPSRATELGFSMPARVSYVDQAYPAMVGSTVTIPTVATNDKSTWVVWETRQPGGAWHTQSGPSVPPNPGITGYDTLVVMNQNTVQILSPNRPTITAPVSATFVHPVVATIVRKQRVVVLGTHGTLWANTPNGSWQRYR